MTNKPNHTTRHNGLHRAVDWIVNKILPLAVIVVVGFGFETALWRVGVDKDIASQKTKIEKIEEDLRKIKERMDAAMSTAAGGHLTHREYNLGIAEIKRRLENLEHH